MATDASTPVASAIGGTTTGRIEQETFDAGVLATGRSVFGGSYLVDFGATRLESSNLNLRLNPQYSSSLELQYTQPLLRDRSIDAPRRELWLARSLAGATDAELERTLSDRLTLIEVSWWNLVFWRDNLQVATTALDQARRQVESNERQSAEGILSLIDVVEAQTQVATFAQAVATSELELARAENLLKSVILADPRDPRWGQSIVPGEVDESPEPSPDLSFEAAIGRALAARPELRELAEAERSNAIDQQYFDNQALPRVDLFGGYAYGGLAGTPVGSAGAALPPYLLGDLDDSLRNITDKRFPTTRLGVTIGLPLGNRTARAQAQIAEIAGEQIEHRRLQLEQAIGVEVRNALQSVSSSRARLDAAGSERRYAEEQYDSERRRFESGLSTVFLVLERQTALVQAQAREVRARADYHQALAELDRSTGSTLERHGVRVGEVTEGVTERTAAAAAVPARVPEGAPAAATE